MRLLSALLPWMPLVAFHLLFGIRHVVWAALLALVGTAGNLLLNAYHFRARATKIFPKVSGPESARGLSLCRHGPVQLAGLEEGGDLTLGALGRCSCWTWAS